MNTATKKTLFQSTGPLLILTIVGVLVVLLVHGILRFSDRVSKVYTPSILAYDNFLEGASHLRGTVITKGKASSLDQSYTHFSSALGDVLRLNEGLHDFKHPHLHDDIILLAQEIKHRMEQGEPLTDPTVMASILQGAKTLAEFHRSELHKAEDNIQLLAMLAGVLSFLILLLGGLFAVREYRNAGLREREVATVSALVALVNALDARDPYTKGHSERVSYLACQLAKKLGLNSNQIKIINLAGLLHDIGKIGIPDSILKKEGKLDGDEYAVMKRHPDIGAKILQDFVNEPDVINALRHHHEHWNGRGYPDGLRGNDIPLFSQILSIADSYDAMTSSRPYRSDMSLEEATAELSRCSGEQWCSELVDAFIEMLTDTQDAPRQATN